MSETGFAGSATLQADITRFDALVGAQQFADVVAGTEHLGPDAPGDLAYLRGVSLVAVGRAAEALTLLERAVADEGPARIFRRTFLAHHWRGKAFDALGDLAGAARAYGAAREAFDDPANAALFEARALDALASDLDLGARAGLADLLRNTRAQPPQPGTAPVEAEALDARLEAMERAAAEQLERLRDQDLLREWTAPFTLRTDHPVAIHSDDHLHPRGTAVDNTRCVRFVRACETRFGRKLKALDLGCAGGGLVRDFLLRGHRAAGLEGSDFSLLNQRAEWRVLPRHLSTCDVLQPFTLLDVSGKPASFDVISAWEVLEHLPRETLPGFFANVRRHLAPGGLFVASVALFGNADPVTGAVWHVTLEPPEWWAARVAEAGLRVVASPFAVKDHARGSGNGPSDWDASDRPDLGFHLVAVHADGPGSWDAAARRRETMSCGQRNA